MSGPRVLTDLINVYVFRRTAGDIELLQMHRTGGPMVGTWQPVMGHIEEGERAPQAAMRELAEETGATRVVGLWALDKTHPYYDVTRDAIVIDVRFACEVDASWEPVLNDEHDDARWVALSSIAETFVWPGQCSSIRDLQEAILRPESGCRDALRIDPTNL